MMLAKLYDNYGKLKENVLMVTVQSNMLSNALNVGPNFLQRYRDTASQLVYKLFH